MWNTQEHIYELMALSHPKNKIKLCHFKPNDLPRIYKQIISKRKNTCIGLNALRK